MADENESLTSVALNNAYVASLLGALNSIIWIDVLKIVVTETAFLIPVGVGLAAGLIYALLPERFKKGFILTGTGLLIIGLVLL
jgi:hypothetical protein